MNRNAALLVCALLALCGLPATGWAQCFEWSERFAPPVTLSGTVRALVEFDDGSGPALYAGGDYLAAGVRNVARWDGTNWSPVGGGFDRGVETLAVFDDGNGPALYAGGLFETIAGLPARGLAKWDGVTWSEVGGGVDGMAGFVYSMLVFDDGAGPALHVGGSFSTVGGLSALNIAKWDGSSWSALGNGANQAVHSLCAFDDGSGPALYAGGIFWTAGGSSANNIARWDGANWSPLGSGMVAPDSEQGSVDALTVFDDGSGAALYAGGNFQSAGGVSASNVARWDGSAWTSLSGFIVSDQVFALTAFDDGSGLQLWAGGRDVWIGGVVSGNTVVRWDGSAWHVPGAGVGRDQGCYSFPDRVRALTPFDDGGGLKLYIAGTFSNSGSVGVQHVARWEGDGWSPLRSGPEIMGMNHSVRALFRSDAESPGAPPILVAGGSFTIAGGASAITIAKWDGVAWSGMSSGILNAAISCFGVHDFGGGPSLLAGGAIAWDGCGYAGRLARWTGSTWTPVPGALSDGVEAIAEYDAGSGPALYVGGRFGYPGHIARYANGSWQPLGFGVNWNVSDLLVHDDGHGSALYAVGEFTAASGVAGTAYIARWNGSTWTSVGGGLGGYASALAVLDDGSGPALIVGGSFTTAGGVSANHVAKWNGTSWSPLGGGLDHPVWKLEVFDDGTGPAIFASSGFDTGGGVGAWSLAKWNGSTWTEVGGVNEGYVGALAAYDDGSGGGAGLFVGGSFHAVGGIPSSNIAEWRGCSGPGTAMCFGDGTLATQCPCANFGEAGRGCANSSAPSGALLSDTGTSNPDTIVLYASGERPTALTIFLQGTEVLTSGVVFGDGLRCASGTLKRLYVKNASAGAVSAPGMADLSITARSAALGDPIAPGTRRYYQTYYRDANSSFCPAPQGNTFNSSNAVKIVW